MAKKTKNTEISERAISDINMFDMPLYSNVKSVLLIGNLIGILGNFDYLNTDFSKISGNNAFWNTLYKRMSYFINLINKEIKITIVGTEQMVNYFYNFISWAYYNKQIKVSQKKVEREIIRSKVISDENSLINFIEKLKKMPKFDYIIQNPPYSGSLHLEFLKKGYELLSDTGKMVIIEPATWLINVRKNGKAKEYNEVKNMLEKHVNKVIIENYNREFDTALYVPFAITHIDKEKEYNEIEFVNCGYTSKVTSLYDCNLIGDYKMIHSIIDKVKSYGDTMKDHIYKDGKTQVDENTWYCKYPEIAPGGMGSVFCATAQASKVRGGYFYDKAYNKSEFGQHLMAYTAVGYYHNHNEISNMPLVKYDSGNNPTDKIADNLYGTKQELENWKHFIFNNKLPLFLNIVLVIDQNNTSKDVLCWLTNKTYTDEEINKLFGFTDDEISLMNKTIKKYERNSPWFKRYMCGKDSVSSEEIQKFVESL